MSDLQLTGAQKSHLRSLGQTLEATVFVGRDGLSPAVLAEFHQAISAHELVKVRFGAERDERARLCEELAAKTGAIEAGAVGKTALFYLPAKDRADRQIDLPAAKKPAAD